MYEMEKQNAATVIPSNAVRIFVNTNANASKQVAKVMNNAAISKNRFPGNMSEPRTKRHPMVKPTSHLRKFDCRELFSIAA